MEISNTLRKNSKDSNTAAAAILSDNSDNFDILELEADSVDATAEVMNVSPSLLWKWIRLNKLRVVRIGRRTLITKAERRRLLTAT